MIEFRPLAIFRVARLWNRLALGFGALLVLMAVVVLVAGLQFRALAAHGEQVMRSDLHRMLNVQEIVQHAQGHGSAIALLLTSPRGERENIYPIVDNEYASIDRLIGELTHSALEPESRLLLEKVSERRRQYREIFFAVVALVEGDDIAGASAMFNSTGRLALQSLLDASHALLDRAQVEITARQNELQAQIRRSEWFLAALAMMALAVSIFLAWRTTSSVAKPLRRVEVAANTIADGDYSARVEVRDGDELGRVALAINKMASAIASREAEIERVAYVDRLTNLPNRSMLRRIARDLRSNYVSIILMDVARLQTVNEVLGFEAGDALLIRIADALRATLKPPSERASAPILARMSGGVFALLCSGVGRVDVERLCERIDATLSGSMEWDGHAVDVHLVYGLADSGGDANFSFEKFLQRAELAIGEAKRTKRKWAWPIAIDDELRAHQLTLLSRLRSAAAAGELEMWLQPKQSLQSGRVVGMEGLVRWRHPVQGYVSPAEFIPFAETTGHIGVVTQAMIESALKTLALWSQEHPSLSIAVNISALARRIEQLARLHHAPLDRLWLELTESSLMEDANRSLIALQSLRGLGVQLSIDDFGTGYSSLAYLQRLPVDELKIDRSFVSECDRKPEARALLRTIIDLGHSLKMEVTAEGVEREEELAVLKDLGCDLAQGFFISRPLNSESAARYIDEMDRIPAIPRRLTG